MTQPPEILHLQQQLSEAKKRIELIRTVTFELNTVVSLPVKLHAILRILHDQFFINYSMILLPDAEGKNLVVQSNYGYDDDRLNFLVPIGTGVAGIAAQKKLPINITGIRRKRQYLETASQTGQESQAGLPGLNDPESQIAIPLIANNQLVAVLLAESYNNNVFNKEDEVFLITLSQSIAVSILNSVLFDNMEEAIAKRTEELRKSNQTKDRLFSLISHDLRGPITSFHNVAKLVNHYNRHNEKNKIEQLSHRIDQSVDKLNTLLDNLLNWALAQTGSLQSHKEPLQVRSLINETLDIFGDAIELKELSIRLDLFQEPVVSGDYNMLSAVFRNVMSNAIKYTPRGKGIDIYATVQDGMALIEFRDSGVGIDPEKVSTLFEPGEGRSTTGTEKEKGTGLGLLVAKEFMLLNGGTINALSETGKGTTVQIFLPLS